MALNQTITKKQVHLTFLYINKYVNMGMHLAAVFFYSSRAFDTVAFMFIIQKLYYLGKRGVLLNLIESYLIGNNKLSSEFCVEHGVS